MEKDRKKATNQRRKKGVNEESDEENILQEVLKILEQLFEARLVERIARPIDRKVREDQIEKYGAKLEALHEKLGKIKSEIIEMAISDNGNARNKSVFGEVTNKPSDWRKIIRSIESKYIEVHSAPPRYSSTAATSSSRRSAWPSVSRSPATWKPSTSRSGLPTASIPAPSPAAADSHLYSISTQPRPINRQTGKRETFKRGNREIGNGEEGNCGNRIKQGKARYSRV